LTIGRNDAEVNRYPAAITLSVVSATVMVFPKTRATNLLTYDPAPGIA